MEMKEELRTSQRRSDPLQFPFIGEEEAQADRSNTSAAVAASVALSKSASSLVQSSTGRDLS